MLNSGVCLHDGERPVAPGEVGEVAIRSEGSMIGYWNDPDRTASVLNDGWVSTGDLGFFDDDGYLFIVDRAKDVIVSGALNIYAIEVERALESHPAVVEAAVFGVPHPKWGEAVHAVVVLTSEDAATADDLVELCRVRLGGAKKPQSIEVVDRLPRNALGKVMKRELRAPHWAGHERAVA
jgi:fatty-acyl-CoA synthase